MSNSISTGMIAHLYENSVTQILNLIKQTFPLQDKNHLFEKLIAIAATIFSNIFNLPILFVGLFILGRIISHYQSKHTKFFYQPSNKLFKELLLRTKLSQMKYKPWTYAFNGHWQALIFPLIETIYRYVRKIEFNSEVYTLSDGGTILLDWFVNTKVKSQPMSLQSDIQYQRSNTLVVIIPGLTGNSSNLYVTSSIIECEKHGYDAVVINYRCNAGLSPTSPRIYHAASTLDIKEAMDYIRDIRPNGDMVGYGISLGSGLLTNYIALTGDSCPLKTAACIGCHFDLEATMQHLAFSFYGIYDLVFGYYTRIISIDPLRIIDRMNEKHNPHRIIGDDIHKISTLNQYVDKIIVKVEGFRNTQHYYNESTCTHNLKDITIPMFFLNANDDPIVGNKAIPVEHIHENILIAVTEAGGHLGYFEGKVLPHKQWFPEPAFTFINFVLKQQEEEKTEQKVVQTKNSHLFDETLD